jgi:outer membrane immunogenic protein
MKKQFLFVAAFCAFGSAAQADEIFGDSTDTPDWTGLYAGANAGAGTSNDDDVHTVGQAAPNIANIAGGARPGRVSLDRSGFVGGGQIGYNYQFGAEGRQYVVGLEADFDYTDLSDRTNVRTAQLVTRRPLNNSFASSLDTLGTVRARLGYVYGRALVYGTGGFAYGETKQHIDMFGPTGNTQFSGDRNALKTGYVAGGGIEYAVTDKISVKAEGLYYDLGHNTLDVAVIPGSGGAGTGYNSRFREDGEVFRLGVNYKF